VRKREGINGSRVQGFQWAEVTADGLELEAWSLRLEV
jgi:hypothetical protein